MKTSHTPGPWRCDWTSNYAHDYRLSKPDGAALPISAPCNDRSEQRANALLIAAAPELLVAARDALQSLARLPDVDGAWRVTCMQQLRSAIEKAERQTP